MPPPDAPEPSPRPAARDELYVYYRAPEAHAAQLQEAAAAMQSALCVTHAGLQTRLLRRPLVEDGQHTWMEVYVLPPTADPDTVVASIERAAQTLQRWTRSPRHVEHFIACAS